MPEYRIRDPRRNKTIVLRGDSPPSEAELHQIFSTLQDEPQDTAQDTGGGGGFAREAWAPINPANLVRGVVSAVKDPIGAARGIGSDMERVGHESAEAWRAGDVPTAIRKGINRVIPVLGPAMDRSADLLAEGRTAEGLGATVGLGASLALPAGVAKVRGVTARLLPRNPNAATRAAVAFAEREGIPVDLATASGNRAAQGLQHLADRSLVGSVVGGKARAAQEVALEQTGRRLAGRVSPTAVGAEQAGGGVQQAFASRAATLHGEANVAYDALRAIEAQQAKSVRTLGGVRSAPGAPKPFTAVPLAVNLSPVQRAMRPTYTALKREAELVPLMGDKARQLTTLDRLMRADAEVPLSVADAALSDLKGMARTDQVFRRTQGQGIAASVVRQLDAQVLATAKQAGPQAVKALQQGRQATKAKWDVIAGLDDLKGEPVQVFNRLTRSQDTGVTLLREVQQTAPQELPRLGRAVLDGLLEKATKEGGYTRAAGTFADWHRLGPATKQMLYGRALASDLDQFFLVAKKMADNPNPSGSAITAFQGGELLGLASSGGSTVPFSVGAGALSALMHSPRAVRLLTRGFTIPIGRRAAVAQWSAELAEAARVAGVDLRLAPALAEDTPLSIEDRPQ